MSEVLTVDEACRRADAVRRSGRRRYRVTTWDAERQRFTPQPGVRCGPYTLFGLRLALRALRLMGYGCHRDDPSVLVEAYDVWRGENIY